MLKLDTVTEEAYIAVRNMTLWGSMQKCEVLPPTLVMVKIVSLKRSADLLYPV